MRTKISLLFFLSLMIISCETNIEPVELAEPANELETLINGRWNIKSLNGGFLQGKTYQDGEIIWIFNTSTKTITIQNNVVISNGINTSSFDRNESGTYSFSILNEKDSSFLIVGSRKGRIVISEKSLLIDYGIAHDDIAYSLKK